MIMWNGFVWLRIRSSGGLIVLAVIHWCHLTWYYVETGEHGNEPEGFKQQRGFQYLNKGIKLYAYTLLQEGIHECVYKATHISLCCH